MKKSLSIILALVICITALSGCFMRRYNVGNIPTTPQTPPNGPGPDYELPQLEFNESEGVSYVMIYNPNIYDETKTSNETKYTGHFAQYVEAIINRADGLEPETSGFKSVSVQDQMDHFAGDAFDLSGNRADGFFAPYNVGDIQQFYCGAEFETRSLKTFTCKYAGQYCNIWTLDNTVPNYLISDSGREFDNKIYNQVVDMFGEPRFANNGRKVNILYYPMDGGLLGFFYLNDLFSSSEGTPQEFAQYKANSDHIVFSVNSLALTHDKKLAYSTMAHEFQHVICHTNYLFSQKLVKSWFNEAMSGYIEEQLYPGSKENSGHFWSLENSSLIRHGQSMYNFGTEENDIGVYGSVYLFSEYLANLAGKDVFSSIYNNWRNSYGRNINEASAIAKAVPSYVYNEIDSSYDFGNKPSIINKDELWLSKLILNYYVSLLQHDAADPVAYQNIKSQALLYDEINPADIEGGGRVIVALKDGKYEVPADADYGFIYIGLDENFNIVKDYVIQ